MDFFQDELDKIKSAGAYREIKPIENINKNVVYMNEKKYIDFSSNNYLGLRDDIRVIESGIKSAEKYGAGSGASRLVTGNMKVYNELEEKTAQFKYKERALIFNSGYDANVGIFSSIFDSKDVIFADKLIHASIIDGIMLSGAKLVRYKHNDITDLEEKIIKYRKEYKKAGVVTESVFSMDGDIGKLKEIAELKEKYEFIFIADEAHATGLFGEKGSGIVEEYNLSEKVDIVMGTFGKALGSQGAYVAADSKIIEFLINRARSFIFTTAMNPFACGASLKAIDIVENEPFRREKVGELVKYTERKFKENGFDIHGSETQIIPVIIEENEKAVMLSKLLAENGLLVSAIRPPTVPQGSARVRITLNCNHTFEEINLITNILRKSR